MIHWPYCDLVVILYFASKSAVTGHAQYSVSDERPCPTELVTFTCTAPGNSLRWEPSDVSRITVRSTSNISMLLMHSGYTVTLIAFNDTTLTSTLSRTAENGITVSCVDPQPTLTTIGSSMIQLINPPGPLSTIRHFTSSSSANGVSVTIGWDAPTETVGRDNLTYTVTILPSAPLSATVLTSTSVTVTAQYNVDYTVSVVATNCAGNSTTADYNFKIGVAVTRGNVAAIAGGVVGGIVVMLLIILGAIVLLVVFRRMGKESTLKSNNSTEMDDIINNPASLTYDEVTVNSEKSAQRLPSYGQLGIVATLEPVVYAVLSSSQKNNTTSTTTANQHQVTYATVDIDATKKQSAKAATLPASPTVHSHQQTSSAPADVDKLLDIDQALVQIRSMKHKWRELAESVRLPETMIEQIEESCCNDSAGCLTEVINQWSCSEQPITWRELADHLSKIGEEQLSKDLMTIHGTSCLPVELNSCLATPNTSYKYDKTPLLPSKSPTVTDDSPGLLNTLTPSRPPKSTGEMVPPRPPKPAPNNEPPALPHPMKQYAKH
ncbi:uncharacterized protein LOC135348343 isoform X2 [Halichondria panicea]|uniref:uncharacterized protein LOC135348343 isoform X2 n=1 Tax=Halichondria panicea TaxID=6063 RepID=UPI00312B4F07